MFKNASAHANSGNKIKKKTNIKTFQKKLNFEFDLTGEFCQAEIQRRHEIIDCL